MRFSAGSKISDGRDVIVYVSELGALKLSVVLVHIEFSLIVSKANIYKITLPWKCNFFFLIRMKAFP